MGGLRIACLPSNEAVETRTTVNCTLPSVEDFKLTIEGVSLHYTKEWDTIAAFHEDNYLYKGEYKAVVEAGDVTVEGYDDVAFRGEQPFTIVARQNTEVAVTAHIANAMIKVEYTDNFLNYFTGGHELALTTAAGRTFDVSRPTEKLLFIAPDSFKVTGTAVKQANASGKDPVTVTLPEMSRTGLKPQTIYTVSFDVSTAGRTTLEIRLDDSLVESVEIDEELNENS